MLLGYIYYWTGYIYGMHMATVDFKLLQFYTVGWTAFSIPAGN